VRGHHDRPLVACNVGDYRCRIAQHDLLRTGNLRVPQVLRHRREILLRLRPFFLCADDA
jgi:hypothetical protein